MPIIRQTQTYLKELFKRESIFPRRQLGQNFLVDLNIHELIANAAALELRDVVLEVGPGAGALTSLLAERAGAIVAVEFDPLLAQIATRAVELWPSVRVIQADALAGKNRINPIVLDQVRSGLAAVPGRRLKLIANLPFSIATPLIGNLLVHAEFCPVLMVVTIQRELADRMCAPPGHPEFSALSVLVQSLADIEMLRVLPPSVFWPKPKVESAVIQITPSDAKRAAVGNVLHFQSVVRRIFLHRRKNLRTTMAHITKELGWSKTQTGEYLESIGIDPRARAESLRMPQFITIANGIPALGKKVEAPE